MIQIEKPDVICYQMETRDEILVMIEHNGKKYHAYIPPLPESK